MFFKKKTKNYDDFAYIQSTLKLWSDTKVLRKRSPLGCDENEIRQLEHKLNILLPEAYKEYLRWAGRDIDGVFTGSEAFIDDVIYNNEGLDDLLIEEGLKHFQTEQHVCFFSHQGYVYYWFYKTADPDPICFKYAETADGVIFEEVGTYSQVLHEMIVEVIPVLEYLVKG